MKIQDSPWVVPIPTRPSQFIGLTKADLKFNIEVDLSQIGTFVSRHSFGRHKNLLYADLQTNADSNLDRRLGSGRSGFFKGKYLKGVGRTLLAGNWHSRFDLYHSSGILFATAGLREFLLTQLLKSKNKEHLIVKCEHLLAKRLTDDFRQHQNRTFKITFEIHGKKFRNLPKINDHVQVLTAKEGNFTRFSNLAWWLCHFPQYSQSSLSKIALFFESFYAACREQTTTKYHASINADIIAATFATSVQRTVEHFLSAWQEGITWGSLHNNFTADGRFLDLETPLVVPQAMFGLDIFYADLGDGQTYQIEPHQWQHMFGFECISYLQQIKTFLIFLKSRLNFFTEAHLIGKSEKAFIHDFLNGLKKYFGKHHVLVSQEALTHLVTSTMTRQFQLGRSQQRLIEKMFICASADLFSKPKKPARLSSIDAIKINVNPLASREPQAKPEIILPKFMTDFSAPELSENVKYNEILLEIEKFSDPFKFLDFIKSQMNFFRKDASTLKSK